MTIECMFAIMQYRTNVRAAVIDNFFRKWNGENHERKEQGTSMENAEAETTPQTGHRNSFDCSPDAGDRLFLRQDYQCPGEER